MDRIIDESLANPSLNPLFTLSEDEQRSLSPIVYACLSVALQEHEGQTRKNAGQMPYVHHLIGAMKTLRLCGVKDQITLGSALLHDVLEDGCKHNFKRYLNAETESYLGVEEAYRRAVYEATKQLKDDLVQHISDAFIELWLADGKETNRARADYLADEVTDLLLVPVKQLTNPVIDKKSGLGDHKRFKQVNSAYQYTPRSQRVKMAEICSTLAEDMLYEPSKKMTKEKLLTMHNRALTLCDMCQEVRPELHDLAHKLVQQNAAILQHNEERPLVGQFDVVPMINEAIRRKPKNWSWEKRSDIEHTRSGILSVALNDKGMVAAYRVMDDPGEKGQEFGMSKQVNKVKSKVTNALGIAHCATMKIGSVSLFDNYFLTRKITIMPKMEVEQFVEIALKEKAMDKEFADRLVQKANEIKRAAPKEHTIYVRNAVMEGPVHEAPHFNVSYPSVA